VQLLFMYGGGDDVSSWPSQLSGDGCTFMARDPSFTGDDPERDAARLVRATATEPVHLVGWSYGGIAALLAAQRAPSRIRSLTLFEPSCADLADTTASTRAFRDSLEPVWRRHSDPGFSDADFLAGFASATGSPLPDNIDARRALARRLRATAPPWETTIPRERLRVPTLVLTGGWADYFEDIAAALVALGAEHGVLTGCGHDVPFHPEAAAALRSFTTQHEPRS
jgi:pimeloyl-ACP methyl ester carboxylesterase